MENKQTAVEWYWNKIKSHFEHDGDLLETAIFTLAIAKQKEREQMEKAYNQPLFSDYQTFEQYYTENYKSNT